MKRPEFTRAEIEALEALIQIAEAGAHGEGDYQDFDYSAMRRAARKLQDLRLALPGKKGAR